MANDIIDWASFGNTGYGGGGDDDRKKKLAALLLQKPELAETIKRNPALLEQLVGKQSFFERLFGRKDKAAELVGNFKQSPADEYVNTEASRSKSMQQLERNPNAVSDARVNLPDLTLDEMRSLASGNPSPELKDQIDAIRSKTLGIDSEIDRTGKKAETAYKEAATANVKQETTLKGEAKDRLDKARPISDRVLAEFGSNNIWRAINGKGKRVLKPEEVTSLYTTHGQLIQDLQQEDLEAQRLAARKKGDYNEAIVKLASQMVLRTGTTVDPKLVVQLLQNPSEARRLSKIKEKDVKPEEKDLWEAAQVRTTYMQREGRDIAKDVAVTFKQLFPRLGDIQSNRIPVDEGMVNEMNNAALQAYQGSGMEPPKFILGKRVITGRDPKVIIRIGGEGPTYTNPAGSYIPGDISPTGKDIPLNKAGEFELPSSEEENDRKLREEIKADNPTASDSAITDAVKRVKEARAKRK